jgi:hypothetical protein
MITKVRMLWAACVVFSLAGVKQSLCPAQETAPVPVPSGIEVLTRGPVHEAYAQPIDQKPGPGQAVPKEPPPPIPEKPPEQQPPGDNVRWISGYWAWDADRNDFIWVSGTFRKAPPGRQFVAGHWVNTQDGWQWVAGFWAPDAQTNITYAAQPPDALNSSPSMPPPDDNSFYVPGYWFYQDSTFIWRPGYYLPNQPGRMWVMPHYVWTPAGYIFVNGYWDYPLDERGLLMAPVWFDSPLWQTAGWSYQPNYWVSLNPLYSSLFWRPGWNQFYFGNYYGANYARLGYRPWYTRNYNPLYNYYNWANRSNANWLAGQQRFFNDRHTGAVAGPARTFAQQTPANRVVQPLNQFPNNRNSTAGLVNSPGLINSPGLVNSSGLLHVNNALTQARITNEAFRTTSATGVPRLATSGTVPTNGFNASVRPGAVPSNLNGNARPSVVSSGFNSVPRPTVAGNPHATARVATPQVRASGPAIHTSPTANHTVHSSPVHSGGGGGHGGRR